MKDKQPNLQWVEKVSRLMDSQFRIPGTKITFGIDPIIGLVPYLGEATTFIISLGLTVSMIKYGASRKVVILMLLNIFLDVTIGSIPIIGDAFDFMYKANQRNIKLLRSHYEEGKYQGSGGGILWIILLVVLAGFSLLIYGFVKLSQWIIGLF